MPTPTDDIQGLAKRLVEPLRSYFAPHGVRSRVYNSNNQTLTTGVVTTVIYNNNRYDIGGLSNANGFTLIKAGYYRFGGAVRYAANSTGQRVLYLVVSGVLVAIDSRAAVTGNPTDMTIETEYLCAAGDTVRMQAYQDSGGNLNLTSAGSYSQEFWISEL